MNFVFAFAPCWWLGSLSVAGTLPKNWKEFIDPDTLSKFDESQSRYDTGKWEGDITNLDPEEMPTNGAANAVDNADLMWPNNTIPYKFTTQASIRFRAAERKRITDAMEVIMLLTGHCVKFVERKTETDYIRFQKGLWCHSDIGRTSGRQIVSYSSACLEHYGSIQHELMHVLGFFHEQSRLDRDKYVTVNWDNIAEENKAQFTQRAGETYGLPYDYESVMHYGVKAFAMDAQLPTILPNVRRTKLGQQENLSPLDVTRIHKRFKCVVPSAKDFMMSRASDRRAVPKLGNHVTEKTPKYGHANSLPVFSKEPMTWEECGLQFTDNCGPPRSTRSTCIAFRAFDINCENEVTSKELTTMITAMPRSTPRATRLLLYDGEYVSFANFSPIRHQIVLFTIQYCRDNRTTGKLPELKFLNLLDFRLSYCYNLEILKTDFRLTPKLRIITLFDSTLQTLQQGTFSDLSLLQIVGLEFRLDIMAEFNPDIHKFIFRLHCSCEFAWYRRWLENNRALIRQAEKGEVYSLPAAWRNEKYTKNQIYLPVDCAAFPSARGAGSLDFDQMEFSVNEKQCLS